MPIPFPTEDWVKALMTELNQSEGYREAAKTWEGDFYFIVNAGAGVRQDMYLYMDLWHGECRAAYAVADPASRTPEFAIEASLPIWRKVIEKKLDPIQGLVTRQLKLKGNMVKVMRVPKAAFELVNCCSRVETAWPEM